MRAARQLALCSAACPYEPAAAAPHWPVARRATRDARFPRAGAGKILPIPQESMQPPRQGNANDVCRRELTKIFLHSLTSAIQRG